MNLKSIILFSMLSSFLLGGCAVKTSIDDTGFDSRQDFDQVATVTPSSSLEKTPESDSQSDDELLNQFETNTDDSDSVLDDLEKSLQ